MADANLMIIKIILREKSTSCRFYYKLNEYKEKAEDFIEFNFFTLSKDFSIFFRSKLYSMIGCFVMQSVSYNNINQTVNFVGGYTRIMIFKLLYNKN